jgi:GNAT superfamily N-acetyltransferase
LQLLDDAIAWLTSTGRTGQWGTQPFSAIESRRTQFANLLHSGITRVAESHGTPVGLTIAAPEPSAYVAQAHVPELYLHLLVTSRKHTGSGIGAALVDDVTHLARARGVGQLRVDCYAGSDGALVRAYQRLGFDVESEFVVERPDQSWPGCVLVKSVQPTI